MRSPENGVFSFEVVAKTTLVESVMEQIIEQIRRGQLGPGSQLPSERTLMNMMNVGRSTVREALQGLAAMNLIETRSGQGSRVKDVRALTAAASGAPAAAILERYMHLQLLEMRQLVEVQVAAWAAERVTDSEIATLKVHLNAYITQVHAGDWPGSYKSHHAFHVGLAGAAHNYVAVRVVDSLVGILPQSLMQKYTARSEEIWQEEIRIHVEIYDALCARDPARIRAALTAHMDAERRQVTEGA
jgi:GntR family transcriptional repressor for pyruvate dehydrogenase complex